MLPILLITVLIPTHILQAQAQIGSNDSYSSSSSSSSSASLLTSSSSSSGDPAVHSSAVMDSTLVLVLILAGLLVVVGLGFVWRFAVNPSGELSCSDCLQSCSCCCCSSAESSVNNADLLNPLSINAAVNESHVGSLNADENSDFYDYSYSSPTETSNKHERKKSPLFHPDRISFR